MKRFVISYLVALEFLIISGMASAQNDVDPQALADRWIQAYNSHDTSGLSSLYAEDAYLMMHGGPTYKGRRAIGEFWQQDFQESNPITTLAVTHSIDGVDMVLVHGNYQVLNRDTGLLLGQGRFAHIWMLNENGEWMLDRDLWNEPFEPYASR